jgi:hypothetical protein
VFDIVDPACAETKKLAAVNFATSNDGF